MRVKSVTRLAEREDVFDIEVPSTHNFCVNGGVVVHNCRYSQEFNIKATARKKFVGTPIALKRKY